MTSTPQSLNTTWSLQFNFSFAQVGIFDPLFFAEFNNLFAAIFDFANLVKKLISKIPIITSLERTPWWKLLSVGVVF